MAPRPRAHFADPTRPPRHGPFAEAAWDPAAGRWRVRLLPAAAGLVADYLARYPRPEAVVARRWPWVVQAAAGRGLGADDLHAAALFGVARAASYFDPAAGAGFVTYAALGARDAVRQELRPRAGEPAQFVRPDQAARGDSAVGWDGVAAVGEWDPDPAGGADRAALLRRYLAALPPREGKIVGRYYGLDGPPARTLAEVGAEHGVTGERARQIIARVIARARQELAGDAVRAVAAADQAVAHARALRAAARQTRAARRRQS